MIKKVLFSMPVVSAVSHLVLCGLFALCGFAACGSEKDSTEDDSAATNSDGAGGDERPVFVVANEVYTGEESISYVTVLRSLDVDTFDYKESIEFPGGRATIATRGGFVFVAPADSPEVQRYRLTKSGQLEMDERISFANYGFDAVTLDAWGNTFISDAKAYLHNTVEGTSVVWNPSEMTIDGEIDLGDFELVRPELGELNGSSAAVRGDRMFRTIFWSNWDEEQTSDLQYLAVYDTETDALIALHEETRCPGLSNLVSEDEEGNFYFSNWVWNVGETILRDAPPSCTLRLSPGQETFDEDFRLDYAAETGGREGAVFSYLADGRGVMSVFYEEESPVDTESTPTGIVAVPAWKLWSVDLNGESTPLEGLGWMLGAVTPLRLQDRSFLLVPGEGWEIIHVHEIKGQRAELAFDIEGWCYQFLQVEP